MSEQTATVYTITSKYGGGYWTTDRAIIDEDVRVDQEENNGSMQFFVSERQVSRAELQRMEAESEGREFPGW